MRVGLEFEFGFEMILWDVRKWKVEMRRCCNLLPRDKLCVSISLKLVDFDLETWNDHEGMFESIYRVSENKILQKRKPQRLCGTGQIRIMDKLSNHHSRRLSLSRKAIL